MKWTHRAFLGTLIALVLFPAPAPAQEPSVQQRQWLLDLHDPEEDIQVAAITALAHTESTRYVVVLLSHTERGSQRIRGTSIQGLGYFPTPEVALALQSILLNSHFPLVLRQTAAQSLAEHGTDLACNLLFDARLTMEQDDPLADEVAGLLNLFYPERLSFLEALHSGDPSLVKTHLDDPLLAETLLLATAEATPRLQLRALRALGALDDPRAIPVLAQSLRSSNPKVREAARTALELFTDESAGWPLATCAASSRLPQADTLACVESLVHRDDAASAAFLLDLRWVAPHLLQGNPALDAAVEDVLRRRIPVRYFARRGSPEANPAEADIELLIDLSQSVHPARTQDALTLASAWPRPMMAPMKSWVREPSFAQLALSSIASRPEGSSRPTLLELAKDTTLDDNLRVLSLEYISQGTKTSAQRDLMKLASIKEDPQLATWATEIIVRTYPEFAVQQGLAERKLDRSGLVPLSIAGAIHGAVGITLFSQAVTPDESSMTILPAIGGAILGGGIPLLLTLGEEVTPSQGVWVLSGGTWGLMEAAAFGLLLSDSTDTNMQAAYGGLFAGQVAGLTAAWLTRKGAGRDWGDVGYTNLSWFMGSLAGVGVALQADSWSSTLAGGSILAGGMGGLLVGGLAGRKLDFTLQDSLHTAVGIGLGGWAGALLFPAIQGDSSFEVMTGGAIIGMGTGFVVGSVLTPWTDVSYGKTFSELAGFGVGNVLGAGLGLVIPGVEPEGRSGLMLGLGSATLALAVSTWDHTHYSPGDLTLLALGSIWGSYQGLAVARIAGSEGSSVAGGAALVGGSTFLLGSAALAQGTEFTPLELTGATGMGISGALFGLGLGLVIPDVSDAGVWAISTGMGWAALVPTLIYADRLKLSVGDTSLIALGTTWGLYQGWGIREAAGGTTTRSLTGSLVLGATSGLLSSAIASQFIDPAPSRVLEATYGGLLGSSIGYGLGELFPQLNDAAVLSTMLSAGWAGLTMKGLVLKPAEFTGNDYLVLAAGGGWGAFQGWLIGRAALFDGEQAAGAIVLGMGLGLIGGELVARASDLETTHVMLTELSSYAGSGLGAGVMLVAGSDNTTANAITTAAAGWGAKALAGWVAPRLEFRGDDIAEYLTLQGWGLWHGAAIAMALDADESTFQGAMLLGTSLGFLLPLLTNQLVDYSLKDDLLIAGCGVWGAWIGAWTPYALGGTSNQTLLWSTVLTDAGLILGGLFLSPAVDMSRRRMGWIHLGGLAGMGLGSSMTAIFSSQGEDVVLGSLIGTGAGLLAAYLSTFSVRDLKDSDSASGSREERSREKSGGGDKIAWDKLPTMYPSVFPVPPPVGSKAPATMAFGVEGIF